MSKYTNVKKQQKLVVVIRLGYVEKHSSDKLIQNQNLSQININPTRKVVGSLFASWCSLEFSKAHFITRLLCQSNLPFYLELTNLVKYGFKI